MIDNSVYVYDDFFTEEIRDKIFHLLLRPKWSPCKGGNSLNWFWHMEGLEKEHFFNSYLFDIICEKLNKKYIARRIYANGQSSSQIGNLHVDDGQYTFVYYPNPEWKIGWNGHLIFSDDGKEPSKIIGYKPNRGILFPSHIKHYADAPHRYFTGFRISLAYKLFNTEV